MGHALLQPLARVRLWFSGVIMLAHKGKSAQRKFKLKRTACINIYRRLLFAGSSSSLARELRQCVLFHCNQSQNKGAHVEAESFVP